MTQKHGVTLNRIIYNMIDSGINNLKNKMIIIANPDFRYLMSRFTDDNMIIQYDMLKPEECLIHVVSLFGLPTTEIIANSGYDLEEIPGFEVVNKDNGKTILKGNMYDLKYTISVLRKFNENCLSNGYSVDVSFVIKDNDYNLTTNLGVTCKYVPYAPFLYTLEAPPYIIYNHKQDVHSCNMAFREYYRLVIVYSERDLRKFRCLFPKLYDDMSFNEYAGFHDEKYYIHSLLK